MKDDFEDEMLEAELKIGMANKHPLLLKASWNGYRAGWAEGAKQARRSLIVAQAWMLVSALFGALAIWNMTR